MKNLSEQGREPATTKQTHIWRRRRDLNTGDNGAERVVTATPTLQPQKGVEKFIKLETVENATVLNEKIKNKRLKHYKKV